MAVTGLVTGLGYPVVSGDAGGFPRIVIAALVLVPAMLVLGGVTMLLYGLTARWSPIAWGVFAWTLVAGLFGTVLELPQWVLNLSPYQHVPALPAAPFEWLPIALLLFVAVIFAMAGLAALDRRDMA